MNAKENILHNREVWGKNPAGYRGEAVTTSSSNRYGGCLWSVYELLIKPYVHSNSIVLEIGPGSGRWTGFFGKAKKVVCVDVIDLSDVLYKKYSSMNLEVATLKDTVNLDFIKDSQIDFIFSFDTFVHLNFPIIHSYCQEFSRVLKNNRYGVIHYSDWEKYKRYTGISPKGPDWPKNNLDTMLSHFEKTNLTVIDSDVNLLLRDRMLIFTKEKNENRN